MTTEAGPMPRRRSPAAALGLPAAVLLIVEVAAALLAEGGLVVLLADLVLLPLGLAAGLVAIVRRRRAREAAVGAEPPLPEALPPAARFEQPAQQWDLVVHAALLTNLVVFGLELLVQQATGRTSTTAVGPVVVATLLIPVSVVVTWRTGRESVVAGEAIAIVHDLGPARRIRIARRIVSASLAPHIVLALAVLAAAVWTLLE